MGCVTWGVLPIQVSHSPQTFPNNLNHQFTESWFKSITTVHRYFGKTEKTQNFANVIYDSSFIQHWSRIPITIEKLIPPIARSGPLWSKLQRGTVPSGECCRRYRQVQSGMGSLNIISFFQTTFRQNEGIVWSYLQGDWWSGTLVGLT